MKEKIFHRILALLLAVTLVSSLLPAAIAAAEADSTPTEATQSATDPPAESTEPAEISGNPTESTAPPVTEPEETIPPETDPEDAAPPAETDPTEAAAEPPGEPEPSEPTEEATEPPTAPEEPTVPTEIELAGQVITVDELGIALLADVTGSLNTKDGLGCDPQNPIQVTYTDALGNSHSTDIKSLKWHYVDQISQPIYCIEPDKSAVDSLGMPGDHVGTGGSGSSNGAAAWYNQLTMNQRRAIGLVLLYGCPNNLWDTTWNTYVSHGNPNAGYRAATQAIIWEFIMGLRSPTAPFDYTSHAQARVFYEQCQGDCMTNGTDNFLYAYEYIIGKLRDHATIPSFSSRYIDKSPTHTMTAQADGSYSLTLTDTNGILAEYDFSACNTAGLTFTVSGSTLTVWARNAASVPDTAIAPARTIPSPDSSTYTLWYSPSETWGKSIQVLVNLLSAQDDPVPAYFKLKAENPTGKLSIHKTTNTGADLAGWQFGVYSDDACTQLVETLTTDANGDAVSGDLSLVTYYVKEIGDTSGRYSGGWWGVDTSVKSVTVVAGTTTAVSSSFNNTHYGRVRIIKTLDTDGSLEGWPFRVTRLADNQDMGVFTSGKDGAIPTGNLLPGDYKIEELIPANSLYYCKSPNPQIVTVKAGETAEVRFTNALRPGKISIEKVNLQGQHLAGAKFLLEWSKNGSAWQPVTASSTITPGSCTSAELADGCLTTGTDGIITFEGLYPDCKYRLTEVKAPDGYLLLADTAWEGSLPVEDLTVTITVHNSLGYTLPDTGSTAGRLLPFMGLLLFTPALCLGILGINGKAVDIKYFFERKKKQ